MTDQQRQPARILRDLLRIEELESESQGIWDDAISNLVYGRLTPEMRDKYVKNTYRATELHAEAMQLTRGLYSLIQQVLSPDNEGASQ